MAESAHKAGALVKCNICDSYLGEKDRVWSCKHCNFDACNACANRANQAVNRGLDCECTVNKTAHVTKVNEKASILVVGRFGRFVFTRV